MNAQYHSRLSQCRAVAESMSLATELLRYWEGEALADCLTVTAGCQCVICTLDRATTPRLPTDDELRLDLSGYRAKSQVESGSPPGAALPIPHNTHNHASSCHCVVCQVERNEAAPRIIYCSTPSLPVSAVALQGRKPTVGQVIRERDG